MGKGYSYTLVGAKIGTDASVTDPTDAKFCTVLDCGAARFGAVHFPDDSALDGKTVSIYAASHVGGSFVPEFSEGGKFLPLLKSTDLSTAWSFTVAKGKVFPLPLEFRGCRALKLVCTGGGATNGVADVSFVAE